MKKILIIDDCKTSQRLLKGMLADYATSTAESIDAAIRAIKSSPFDLILIDQTLPDGQGTDLLKIIQEITPNTPCIMVTITESVHLAVEAMQSGAIDFVLKPVRAEELQARIKKFIL